MIKYSMKLNLSGKIVIALIISFAFLSVYAAKKERKNLIINGGFDQWEWVPISPNMAKAYKAKVQKGENLNFEHRGPLYRKFKGLYSGGFPGLMVEGKDAYKGKSLYLVSGPENGCVIGLHAPYNNLIEPGKEYQYEVCLKGKGDFMFRAWVSSTDPATGRHKWLGFPNLINITPTEKWKLYKGTFKLPEYKNDTFVISHKISCAIVIDKNSALYVDEFKITEK